MSSPVVAPRAVPVSGRTVALFGGAVVTLAVAFVVAPRLLAGTSTGTGYADRGALAVAFGEAFTGYWRSGAPELPPRLEQVVEYWFRYHVVKAVVAAALLAVLAVLAVRLWRACARGTAPGNGRAGRITSGAGAVAATVLAAASALLVMANIQGAVAPFASLLPLLNGSRDPELAGALGQVREQLADPPAAGRVPALGVMVDDFSRYHLAMAVIAGCVAVLLAVLAAVAWRRFAATRADDRRGRRLPAAFGLLAGCSALLVSVVAVANTATASDAAPALLALFEGGW